MRHGFISCLIEQFYQYDGQHKLSDFTKVNDAEVMQAYSVWGEKCLGVAPPLDN